MALLVDATIVRCVLVPASMKLLGERNWYLPSWLNWLPDVHVEGHTSTDAAGTDRQTTRETPPPGANGLATKSRARTPLTQRKEPHGFRVTYHYPGRPRRLDNRRTSAVGLADSNSHQFPDRRA